MNDATPIWQRSVGEFKELLHHKAPQVVATPTEHQAGEFVYGIAGLARFLQVSKTTAQKLKSSGALDKAITQVGRQTIINKTQVLEILKKHNK